LKAYFEPLKERAGSIKEEMTESPALNDIEEELAICSKYLNKLDYRMLD